MLAALSLVCFSGRSIAATQCPNPGERPATANDAVVKDGTLPIGTCYNPNTVGINQSAESAVSYLLSLPRSGSALNNASITSLNSSFAMCAANFLKAFTGKYGNVTITSGYRSSAYDAAMCRNNTACGALMNNPNPMGNHQKGLAMDVNAGANQTLMNQFAQQNPQFGVCFPFSLGGVTGAGKPDTVHMILAGIPGSEPNGAGCKGVTKACTGSNFNPNNIPAVVAAPNANTFIAPASPNQQIPAGYCLANTNPLIYVPCSSAPQTAQPAPITSTAPASVAQGAAATTPTIVQTSPLSVPTASSATSSANVFSNLLQTQPLVLPSTASSAIQALNIVTNLGAAASSSSAFLNQNLNSIVNDIVPGNATGTVAALVPTGTIADTWQSTFGAPSYATPTTVFASPFQQILGSLKSILTNLLSYLQSFGQQPAQQQYTQ